MLRLSTKRSGLAVGCAERLSLLVARFLIICRVVVLHQGAMRDRGLPGTHPDTSGVISVPSASVMIQLALSGAIRCNARS